MINKNCNKECKDKGECGFCDDVCIKTKRQIQAIFDKANSGGKPLELVGCDV